MLCRLWTEAAYSGSVKVSTKHLNQNFTGACYLQRGHLVRIGKKMNNSF